MRLDPVDEIQRLYQLLTAGERVRFLAWIYTAPSVQRPADDGRGQDDDLVTGDAARAFVARKFAEARELERAARLAWAQAQAASDRCRRLRAQGRGIPAPPAVDSPPSSPRPLDVGEEPRR